MPTRMVPPDLLGLDPLLGFAAICASRSNAASLPTHLARDARLFHPGAILAPARKEEDLPLWRRGGPGRAETKESGFHPTYEMSRFCSTATMIAALAMLW